VGRRFEAVCDHFVDVNKMVKIGSGAERKQDDMKLPENDYRMTQLMQTDNQGHSNCHSNSHSIVIDSH